ncbi:hypertrophic agonist responsive protein [Salpingoeca rosetta]|uniref:Hypertrophic agonist responsive protein n=1 Tax=Salpingoeca rosetta (strain ATCC 50818 / BSB-021) TaxID=946362 RepID=F2UH19_SALR5|nr:hypertrophic agonist responsive protein [Salpingoeca rosetta]EGD76418.1 hypertrophic agonist responsive protein [Salpingoeca rosetta]|eukprot:XP_004991333.1 hypertrophic agonist responsive protein [Salpingoeca rosetta]
MEQPPLRDTAVLFGDSITQYSFAPQGWGAGIAHAFQRKVDVVNRGFSGYTTRSARAMLKHIFPEQGEADPHLFVTVFFGANDAAQECDQHVPIEEYEENLDAILSTIKRRAKHVVMIAPPPVDHVRWPTRHNTHVQRYAAVASRAAERHDVPCVNLYKEWFKADWMAMLNDGLHFSDAGNQALLQLLLERLPIQPDDLPFDFPLWRDVLLPDPSIAFRRAFVKSLPYACRHRCEDDCTCCDGDSNSNGNGNGNGNGNSKAAS